MRLTIHIDIDDAELAELLGLPRRPSPPPTPPVRPFAEGLDDDGDEPPDVNRDDRPARPRTDGSQPPATGRELLGWISGHGGEDLQRRAVTIARSRGYGTMLVKLSPDQVADVYRELQKPARGRQKWGS